MNNQELILEMLADGLAVESMDLQDAVGLSKWHFRKAILGLSNKKKILAIHGKKGSSKFSYKINKNDLWANAKADLASYPHMNCFKRKITSSEAI